MASGRKTRFAPWEVGRSLQRGIPPAISAACQAKLASFDGLDDAWKRLGIPRGFPEGHGPGAWHHVVGIVDQAAGEDRIYVNGQFMASEKWPKDSSSPDLGGQRWTVGMVKWDKDTYFARGALSAAEVASLHTAGPEKGSSQPR